jgi:hypothetical protein
LGVWEKIVAAAYAAIRGGFGVDRSGYDSRIKKNKMALLMFINRVIINCFVFVRLRSQGLRQIKAIRSLFDEEKE